MKSQFSRTTMSFIVMLGLIYSTTYQAPQPYKIKAPTQPTQLIKGATRQTAPAIDPAKAELRKLLGEQDYVAFVEELGKNIDDPKFMAVLKAGSGDQQKHDDVVHFDHNVSYPCSRLIPTQSEIDVEKSLKYPLTIDSSMVLQYLKGGVFTPGGPIVTAGNKWIIDGHHRWSQLYLINPAAKISAMNMRMNDPARALKTAQLAIAAETGHIASSTVEGKNLFTMSKDDFAMWIRTNISQKATDDFAKGGINGVEAIIDHIWKNAERMKKYNQPIKGASNRGYMPQTDTASGWDTELEKGEINVRRPL